MDYITRRAAAEAGHWGCLMRASNPRFPRLAALGVRIEPGATVIQAEIAQALRDLKISIPIPPGVYIPAEPLEAALAHFDPETLKRDINAFLRGLA
ncbi:MAG: hypothetical protein PSV13_03965 [Lacunisphaera sp.]|nr:hypothetical protein [Lacunisphaera sp.]